MSDSDSKSLNDHIAWVIDAHQNHPKKPSDAIRFWDGKTPYYIHPIWCGMTMLTETGLPDKLRWDGALALLYHDVLEDTTKGLPNGLSAKVVDYVNGMTFSGIEEEMIEVWNKGDEIVLLKLYDKISNLMDAIWMKDESLRDYESYTEKLLEKVITVYGNNLNIVKIAGSKLNER